MTPRERFDARRAAGIPIGGPRVSDAELIERCKRDADPATVAADLDEIDAIREEAKEDR